MDINKICSYVQKGWPNAYVKSDKVIASSIKFADQTVYTEVYVGAASIQIEMYGGETDFNDSELEHYVDVYNELFASNTGFKAYNRMDKGNDKPRLMFVAILTNDASDEYEVTVKIGKVFEKLRNSGNGIDYFYNFLVYVRNKYL